MQHSYIQSYHLLASLKFCRSKTQNCVQDYKDHMEPLVLEECAALLLRGDDNGETLKPFKSIVSASIQVSLV